MRSDEVYLHDTIEALRELAGFVNGVDEPEFRQNPLLRKAVLMQLVIVGEAANHLGPDLQARYPAIPWTDIIGFRNYAVHAYFQINWEIVWRTAIEDAPSLLPEIEAILANEFSEDRRGRRPH